MTKIIMEGWFKYRRSSRITPKDTVVYDVSFDVVSHTSNVLKEYGNLKPANEGFVYWAGIKSGNRFLINTLIIPETDSDEGRVTISPESNFYFVTTLSNAKVEYIAQVHSHPKHWVDHSHGDNEWAPFKHEGLVSIVVPKYGKNGMLPLKSCGVHRYQDGSFIRLANRYLRSHLNLVDVDFKVFDLRNKKDKRWM